MDHNAWVGVLWITRLVIFRLWDRDSLDAWTPWFWVWLENTRDKMHIVCLNRDRWASYHPGSLALGWVCE